MIKVGGKQVTWMKIKNDMTLWIVWSNVNEGKKRQYKIRYTKDINP